MDTKVACTERDWLFRFRHPRRKALSLEELKAKHAYFETVAARLEALELRKNHSIHITAEKSVSMQ